MKSRLLLRVKRVEGALLRVMGLIGRRGHEIERMVVRPTDDGSAWNLSMLTLGDRPVDVLIRQIMKLVDVEEVTLTQGAKDGLDHDIRHDVA